MKYLLLSFIILFTFYNLYRVKENLSNKNTYNVYLISNKPNLSSNYIKKVNSLQLNKNDKIIRFNHSQNGNIFKNKTDILFLRNNSHSYRGYEKPIWYDLKNKRNHIFG